MSTITNLDEISRVLGGQFWLNFEGDQEGIGFLSTDKSNAKTSFVTLYQYRNNQTELPSLYMQGRLSFDVCNDTEISGKAISLKDGGPDSVSITAKIDPNVQNKWTGSWTSTDGFSGQFVMNRLSSVQLTNDTVDIATDWTVLSNWIFKKQADKYVFRGLGDSNYKLESTAHRAGIFDTHHYLTVVIPRVKAELLARHGIRIPLDKGEGLAEFLALIRHHGFPTPIIDWSKSPWVALYFAISSAKNSTIDKCRVYALEHDGIDLNFDVAKTLLEPSVYGPMVEIPTPLTSRVAAQEGVFLLSPCINVLVGQQGTSTDPEYARITAIDIRKENFEEFLNRLDQMMINEASMMGTIDATLNYLQQKLVP